MAKNQFDIIETRHRDKKFMEEQYIKLKKSGPKISKELGIGITTTQNWLERHNIKIRKWNIGKYMLSLNPEQHPAWKGNKFSLGKDGYYKKKTNGKTIFKHQEIWEQHHKRKVKKGYTIHHIDGNPSNNDIKNLALIKWNIHVAYHNLAKQIGILPLKFEFEIENGEMKLK